MQQLVDGLLQDAGVVVAQVGLDAPGGMRRGLDGGHLAGLELRQGDDVPVHPGHHRSRISARGSGEEGEANEEKELSARLHGSPWPGP